MIKGIGGKNSAIFLDRDGVINVDKNYPHKPEDFELIPGAAEGLKLLSKAGFKLVIITNQAGIGRGYYTHDDFHRFMEHLYSELMKHDVRIEKHYYCPHHPEHGIGEYRVKCRCRKPEIGMLKDAEKELNIDMGRSWVVGDREHDIIAGKRAGCRTIFVLSGYGKEEDLKGLKPDFIAKDLYNAAEIIIKQGGQE